MGITEVEGNVTDEMKEKLKRIADLCEDASDTCWADEATTPILNHCNILTEMIDKYLGEE